MALLNAPAMADANYDNDLLMAAIPSKSDPIGSPSKTPVNGLLSGLPLPVGISLSAVSPRLASGRDKAVNDPAIKDIKSRASLLSENVSAALLELNEKHPLEHLPPWLRQCHDEVLA